MKSKLVLGMLAASFMQANITFAQDEAEPLKNKNGVEILPKAGQIGLGFNAVPVLTFLGNTMNGNTNNTSIGSNKFVGFFGANTIFGKYMLEDKAAVRAHIRIANSGQTFKNYVIDDTKNNPDSMVTDQINIRNTQITLAAGYEMRRGKGRVQGFYGGELFVAGGRANQRRYEYGNTFGMLNAAPTSTAWQNSGGVLSSGADAERPVSRTGAGTFGIGVRAFAGVEYFFAPQMSLGAEFGWTFGYNHQGESVQTTEYYEATSGKVLNNMVPVAGSHSFGLDTDNFGGAIYLMCYF